MVQMQPSAFTLFVILLCNNIVLGSCLPGSQNRNFRRDNTSLFGVPILPNNNWIIGHDWIPSVLVANSSRSPCPMLNTLANHGFLSRTGRNITKDMFNKAQVDALNMTPDLASRTTNAMIKKLGSPVNESESFNLDDFAAHDATEHDASLTRADEIQGSVIDVDPALVHMMIADSEQSLLNAQSIGRSRVRREKESLAIGSQPLSPDFVQFAHLEASFIILVFGTGGGLDQIDTRAASKEQVKEWFNEERFPIDIGYYRSQIALTSAMQDSIISSIGYWYCKIGGELP